MIKLWFQKLFSYDDQQKIEKDKNLTEKAMYSHQALMSAAASTMSLAADVTETLKDRIDDYITQIETTSFLLNDALFMVNEDGIIETFNPSAERIFKWKSSEVIGMPLTILFITKFDQVVNFDLLKNSFTNASWSILDNSTKCSDIRGKKRNNEKFFVDLKVSIFKRKDNTTHYLYLIRDITKEMISQQEYNLLFNKQKSMLEAIPDIIITVDRNNIFTSMILPNNFKYSFSPDNCIGKTVSELYPMHHELFERKLMEIRHGYGVVTWEFTLTRADSSLNYYEARGHTCGEEVLVLVRDITPLRSIEDDLMESEEHFRAFGQASSEAMMIHNGSKILDWNPRLSEMTGYSSFEISNMKPIDFIHPLERETIWPILHENHPRVYETLCLTKTGDILEIAVNSKPVEWKNELARIKVIRDVTHYRDVEKNLKLLRERYKSIVENTIDLVYSFDNDLNITFANSTFWEYMDLNPGVYNLRKIIPIEDHVKLKNYIKSIDIDSPIRRTLHRIIKNDEIRWLDCIDRAVFNEHGILIEYQSIGRDVTKYMERQNKIITIK